MRVRYAAAALALAILASGLSFADGIRIDRPQEGEVVYDISGNLFVEAELAEIDASPDMRFRLLMDGRPITPDGYVTVFPLDDVPPGPHVLHAQIVDPSGKVMHTSDPVGFVMRRTPGPSDD